MNCPAMGDGWQRRPLGLTGLSAAPLGLGLAALGRPGYITRGHGEDFASGHGEAPARRRAWELLDLADSLGIDYFDAARSYGLAERFLAGWLSRRPVAASRPTVASKWGYTYTAAWRINADRHEVKDHSAATFARQRDESQALLGAVLAIYQIHSVTPESGVFSDRAVLAELAELRASGVVIGFTTSGPRQAEVIRRALTVRWDGRPLFGLVQATWNPLEPSAGPALAEARAAGLGVVIKEALANGRLALRRGEAPSAIHHRLLAAVPEADDPSQAALALALAQPFVDIVLSGAVTAEQLRANAAAVPLAAAVDPAAAGEGSETPARYWANRAALPWN